jgi:predicted dehydrogenase
MKLLVVGCGSIGKRHLRNLQRLGETDLIACDVRKDRRTEVFQQLGVPTVEDVTPVLGDGVQGVLVCTPTSLHTEYARRALRAGAHVFIEKPIAHSLDGLDELLALAERSKRTICVGCNFRFERGMRHVKRLLDDGAIGRPLGVRAVFGQYLPDWHPWEDYRQGYSARRELGGGVLLDAVHEVDYLTWLLGPVKSVVCFTGKVSDLQIDVEDHAAMLLRFPSGIVAEVHVDYLQRAYQRSLDIYGSEGTLTWSFQDREVRWFSAATKSWQVFRFAQDPTDSLEEMYLAEMQHFIQCCRDEALPMLDGPGARRVLHIALAAKESAATNRIVDVPL